MSQQREKRSEKSSSFKSAAVTCLTLLASVCAFVGSPLVSSSQRTVARTSCGERQIVRDVSIWLPKNESLRAHLKNFAKTVDSRGEPMTKSVDGRLPQCVAKHASTPRVQFEVDDRHLIVHLSVVVHHRSADGEEKPKALASMN